MDTMLIWGIVLIGLAVVLGFAELFVPSHGALGLTSGVLAIAGVVCMFKFDTTWGVSSGLALIVLAPMGVGFGLKIWPHTPLGKRIIGAPTEDEVEQERRREEAAKAARRALIGKSGTVLTDLRPVGKVDIDGHRHEVLSETSFISAGTRVKVTHADLEVIKVREA
ncbi:MAG TPA: NfeD family protein [Phycisphaerales bacterium]|nr:NfeD family protein [Phycisphaerales bacterium]